MRRSTTLALALLLPLATVIGGSASAAPSVSGNTSAPTGSMHMAGMDMSGMDMSGMDMSGMDMSGTAYECMTKHPARAKVPAGRPGRLPVIHGCVGPSSLITVDPVKVPAGRYKLVVQDYSNHHNWHMAGAGVDVETPVIGMGKTVWRVDVLAGNYHIQCDAHTVHMRTHLKVV